MSSQVRSRINGEDGFALAIVMLGGMMLVLITGVIASRALRQVGTVSGDVKWEQSLNVAESCLDAGLGPLDGDPQWTTGETLDTDVVGTSAEREWAVDSAEARSAVDLVTTPEGECAIVKPANADFVYGVGFTPSRSSSAPRVRVVRATVLMPDPGVQVFLSFLTNDVFEINGNPFFKTELASAHTNARVEVAGNPTFDSGCLTASDGGSVTGNVFEPPSCPGDPYDQPAIDIVPVVPREFWALSEFDMCPDGVVRAGPSHPILGSTAGAEPCTGLVLEADAADGYRGWTFDGCCDSQDWAEWSYSKSTAYDGAYYFYQGSAVVSGNPGTNNNPWDVLIIAEARGSCSDQLGGDVVFTGNMAMAPYRIGTNLADNRFIAVAGRDADWHGNGKLKAPGIVAAGEQIHISGEVEVEGGFVGEDRCDSQNDHVSLTAIDGNPTFRLVDPLDTPWTSGTTKLAVIRWDEL